MNVAQVLRLCGWHPIVNGSWRMLVSRFTAWNSTFFLNLLFQFCKHFSGLHPNAVTIKTKQTSKNFKSYTALRGLGNGQIIGIDTNWNWPSADVREMPSMEPFEYLNQRYIKCTIRSIEFHSFNLSHHLKNSPPSTISAPSLPKRQNTNQKFLIE